jgi:SAM-dependent methyltransferase
MEQEIVKRVWSTYGTTEPYWSVLTEDKYKMEKKDEDAEAEFWASGANQVSWLKSIYENYWTTEEPRVLDYGCGVGRLTKPWSKAEGCDISEPHLELARKHCPDRTFHLIQPGECPVGYDVIYSLIVLQHNRPELMKTCFQNIVKALNPQGIAILHAPYYIQHVCSSDTVMEMNYLPKADVVKAVEEVGGQVLSYNEDNDLCGGDIKNCVYVIYKKVEGKVFFKRVLREFNGWNASGQQNL